MRTRRNEKLLLGADLFGKFNKNPEHEEALSRHEAVSIVTYSGYSLPTQILQNWIDQKKIQVTRDNNGNIVEIRGRDVFNLCNAYRSRQIEKNLIKEATITTIPINLRSDIKELFIKMAHHQNVTLSQLLSDHLTKLGEEKIEELNQRVAAEMEAIKNRFIDQVSL